jgi:hypothetical protein
MRGCGGDAIEALDPNLVVEIELIKTAFGISKNASWCLILNGRVLAADPTRALGAAAFRAAR